MDHLYYSHLVLRLKKHTSHFKPINRWPRETVLFQQRFAASTPSPTWALWHAAPLKAYWLQPSARALSSCDIALTEAYFHNILSGSSTCPPPGFPLRCSHCLRFIARTWYSAWVNCMEMSSLVFAYDTCEEESAVGRVQTFSLSVESANHACVQFLTPVILTCSCSVSHHKAPMCRTPLWFDSGGIMWQELKRQIRVPWKCHKSTPCANTSSPNVLNVITVYEYRRTSFCLSLKISSQACNWLS